MNAPSDQERFERLFHSTRTDLLAYLRRRSDSPDDAAEALAETYTIAWQKLDSVPQGPAATLWLYGVARKVVLRGVRRRRVNEAVLSRLAGALALETQSRASDELQLSEEMTSALSRLRDRDREILLLNAWEDLAPAEIATVLRMSPNAVRIRLHRARFRLAHELDLQRPQLATAEPAPDSASHAECESAVMQSSKRPSVAWLRHGDVTNGRPRLGLT
jgi:RNA polymerase sigma factor (sigma-70 family)